MNIKTHEAFDQLDYLRKLVSQTRLRVTDSYLHFLVWGVLWIVGYLGSIWFTYVVWAVIGAVGGISSALIAFRYRKGSPPPVLLKKIGWLMVVLIIYMGLLFGHVLTTGDNHQLVNSFWPFHFGLLYILAGIFWGPQMIAVGGWLVAVATVGYWIPVPMQEVWLALTAGGGLVFTGIQLRRQVVNDE